MHHLRTLIVAIVALIVTAIAIPDAYAQLTKLQAQGQVTADFPTQTNGQITPAVLSAFLNNIIASYQQFAAVNAQTGTSYTIKASDYGQLVTLTNSSPVAVTVPQPTGTLATFNFYVQNLGAGTVTLTPTASSICGASTLALTTNQWAWVVSDGVNYQCASQFLGQSATDILVWPPAGIVAGNLSVVAPPGGATINCGGSTTKCLQEVVNAALTGTGTINYDLDIFGCNPTGGGPCGIGAGVAISFPPFQGKRIRAGALAWGSMQFDSGIIGDFAFAGGQYNTITVKPTNLPPQDHVVGLNFGDSRLTMNSPSNFYYDWTNGGSSTGTIVSINELNGDAGVGGLDNFHVPSPPVGTNYTGNIIQIGHLHGTQNGLTALAIGDSGAIGGGAILGKNFWEVHITTDHPSLTGNGIVTKGSNDFILATIDQIKSGSSGLSFASGACGNIAIIPYLNNWTTYSDANGVGTGCGNIVVGNDQILIDGSPLASTLSPTFTGSFANIGYTRVVPTTGFSNLIGTGVYSYIVDPAGTLASGTITLPAAPTDGTLINILFSHQITSLTLSPSAGQTVTGIVATGTVYAGGGIQCLYRVGNTNWYCSWNGGVIASAGTLALTTINVATAYQFGGTTVLDETATYTRLADPSGNRPFFFGNTSDPTNYLYNTTTLIGNRAQNVNFAQFTASGISLGNSTQLAFGSAAPTISSGFCATAPSISANNGTAAFDINVGTSCSGSIGTLGMPTATTGWSCSFADVTTPASYVISQTGGSASTVTLTAYARTTGVASNFTASDHIRAECVGY